MPASQPAHIREALKNPLNIAVESTDFETRPPHRGHTVQICGWSEEFVSLLIISDTGTAEAIIHPDQLARLAEIAKQEAPRW